MKYVRKISAFFAGIFLFSVLFALPTSAEKIVPDGVEHVDSYDVILDINSDATLSVVEKIDYVYAQNSQSAIKRYVPLKYKNLDGKKISISVSDISVNDENGKKYQFSQATVKSDDKKKSYLEIAVVDEDRPAKEKKTYIIHYNVSGAINFLADRDELFWNITGDKWPVYVRYPEVKISLPQRVEQESISKKCFVGIPSATIDCVDKLEKKKTFIADYSYKGVVAGEGMTVVVSFPKKVVEKFEEQQNFWGLLRTDRRVQVLVFLEIILLTVFALVYSKKALKYFPKKKFLEIYSWIKESFKNFYTKKLKNKNKKRWVIAGIILIIIFVFSGVVVWKFGNVINKISLRGESVGSIVSAGLDQKPVKGEEDDRINILLLGVLGANHPGGGLNTDTIMIMSLKPKENKMSIISIPRDLWVTDPDKDTKSKINAVYVYGEEKGEGKGIEDMKKLISEISGVSIHYAVLVSTQAFAQLVDTLGGVEVTLAKPFEESAQFTDIKVCDSETYTIPTGEFQYKKNEEKKIVAEYPLCKNKNPECGGAFSLPAGKSVLDGEKALCFVRSRYLTSDFERAKRQQLMLQQIKEKATQIGVTDFGKINEILNNLGDNVRTDMQLWEMRRLFELYKGMNDPKVYQKVLDDSKEGLLYSPDKTPETGFILLPRGDNYDKIQKLFQNIFDSKN